VHDFKITSNQTKNFSSPLKNKPQAKMWPQQPPFFYEFLVILFIKRKAMIEQKKRQNISL